MGWGDRSFGMVAGEALALSLLCSALFPVPILGQECDPYGPRKDCGMNLLLYTLRVNRESVSRFRLEYLLDLVSAPLPCTAENVHFKCVEGFKASIG